MTAQLTHLTDDELVIETKRAADLERRSTTRLLALLIEVERRALHLTLGCSSMFAYCTRVLLLSEQAAFKRITAARAARRYPVILERLSEGDLTLSSVKILAPHLTDDTADALLEAARQKTSREVEQLVAAVCPQPDIPATVRALPAPRPNGTSRREAPGLLDGEPAPTAENPSAETGPMPPPSVPRSLVAPISPRKYLLRVTLDDDTHDKLNRARSLLRHSVPDGDLASILDHALTLLLREAERTKWASARRPRPSRAISTHRRYVPASVKRTVWSRDAGCCAFVGPAGRCAETGFLEFHHVVPFSDGGATDERNLELRCRAHNQHEAAAATPRPQLAARRVDGSGRSDAWARASCPSARDPRRASAARPHG